MASLVIVNAAGRRKQIPIGVGAMVMGRHDDCDIHVPEIHVSRRHCTITINDELLQVQDLSSRNGTFVNNQKVEKAALADGDKLRLGHVVFWVEDEQVVNLDV
ncbi:MAG: FHA domain-containing protein [Phycisphaerae bacterium]|nr:FHA domain-containing protein [Phycisphaerae bacterium]